jgi:Sec-independent protein translocase protein TatA
MLAFLSNLGLPELLVILVIAVLIFGKDLPQAASKAYLQARKLRGAVDDLRRDSGIERELRDIERSVREAEWEARKKSVPPPAGTAERPPMRPLPTGPSQGPGAPAVALPAAPAAEATPSEAALPEAPPDAAPPEPPRPTDAAS